MADNYLEKRYAEVFGGSAPKAGTRRPGLDILLARNRSFRGYDKSYTVLPRQLETILAVNTKLPSGMNAQRLRFHPVTKGPEAETVLAHIGLGAALPELHLPLPGTEPEAFIIVCATCEENPIVDIDLGISLQSMALKAVEMGLGCVMIRNFKPEALQAALALPLRPLAVLAVGKPAEQVELRPVHAGEPLKYYREEGRHIVPKIILEDLIC